MVPPSRHGTHKSRPDLFPGLLLGLLFAGVTGCGIPGAPVPPLPRIPQPVGDLSAEQRGDRLILRWTQPNRNTDGSRLEQTPTVEIYQATLGANEAPDQVFAGRARVAYTLPAETVAGFLADDVLTFPIPLEEIRPATEGTLYLAVRALTANGKHAGYSNLAGLQVRPVPAPVRRLQATLTEEGVQLRWAPVGRATDGAPMDAVESYRIYRSSVGAEGPFQALANSPEPQYRDTDITWGKRYFYRVAALARFEADRVEGMNSDPLEVVAEDRFPPPPPARLVAASGPGRVDLTWDASPAPDLAGYIIFRSERPAADPESAFVRLNSEPTPLLSFSDTTAEPGVRYYYAVRAIDAAGNESSLSEATSATPFQPD